MKKLNTVISSRINRSLVLTEIFRNPQISRAQLAGTTSLDPSAITHISKELIDRGLVEENEKGKSSSRGGRCPVFLRIRPACHSLLAIEVGPEQVLARLCDLEGGTIEELSRDIVRGEPLIDVLVGAIEAMRERQGDDFAKCLLISIGLSGVVDHRTGIVATNFYHRWKDVPVRDAISEKFGLPVFVENDANAAAIGEISRGRSEQFQSLVYFFLRSSLHGETSAMGVGGALVVNGKIWNGANGWGGEAGFTLNQRIAKSRKGKTESLISLLEEVENGNAQAKRECRRIAREIAEYLVELAVFVDPEAVMVQMVPSKPGQFFAEWIQSSFHELHAEYAAPHIRFMVGSGQGSPALRGLVALGLNKIFVRSTSETSILFDGVANGNGSSGNGK